MKKVVKEITKEIILTTIAGLLAVLIYCTITGDRNILKGQKELSTQIHEIGEVLDSWELSE